ncbi:hypothetical protein B9Z19DRAFT_1064682 [Tuber borchii]|uniref:Secreted protein n=1 Tax=Tuber borchii TaxID=42251 RepID=A0A2T6ZU42_TUBBO|nr:hypothetical protein B9Z19DRAFT_1064682 [Tuber borchii]
MSLSRTRVLTLLELLLSSSTACTRVPPTLKVLTVYRTTSAPNDEYDHAQAESLALGSSINVLEHTKNLCSSMIMPITSPYPTHLLFRSYHTLVCSNVVCLSRVHSAIYYPFNSQAETGQWLNLLSLMLKAAYDSVRFINYLTIANLH